MDLTLLRAFVTVAREGNLTRAAVQLHVSQPAVSLQIKNLQETLGVALFSRTSHGLILTRDGEALLQHAERALNAASEVLRVAAALRHEVSGRLTIGTILDPEFLRLGGFLRALVETYPRIETALRHGMVGWGGGGHKGAAFCVRSWRRIRGLKPRCGMACRVGCASASRRAISMWGFTSAIRQSMNRAMPSASTSCS